MGLIKKAICWANKRLDTLGKLFDIKEVVNFLWKYHQTILLAVNLVVAAVLGVLAYVANQIANYWVIIGIAAGIAVQLVVWRVTEGSGSQSQRPYDSSLSQQDTKKEAEVASQSRPPRNIQRFSKIMDGTEAGKSVPVQIHTPDGSPPPNPASIFLKVSDRETKPEDYGEPLDIRVHIRNAHRFRIPGKGYMFLIDRLEITNRSAADMSLEPRVVIKRDPHSIPDPVTRDQIRQQKPNAVEASVEIMALDALPEEAREWVPGGEYHQIPIAVGSSKTVSGHVGFLLREEFYPFIGTEYRDFDLIFIDRVSDKKAVMPWGNDYPA